MDGVNPEVAGVLGMVGEGMRCEEPGIAPGFFSMYIYILCLATAFSKSCSVV